MDIGIVKVFYICLDLPYHTDNKGKQKRIGRVRDRKPGRKTREDKAMLKMMKMIEHALEVYYESFGWK